MRLVLPNARENYDRREEQNFREWVRRNIETKLDQQGLPQFSGIPLTLVSGASSAWNAPTGVTPTKVPFDTVMTSNNAAHLFSTSNNDFTIAFSGAFRLYVHLFHNGGGANKTVNIAVCVFRNGTEALRNTTQRALDQIWNVEGTFVRALTAGDVIDIRVQHTETVNVAFDLTYSRIMLEQLTADPHSIDRSRI